MGKQTNATVYYCDKCRKPIIGSPNVLQHAEYFSTAHGILPEQESNLDNLPFSPNQINKFIYPELVLTTGNVHSNDNSHDLLLSVESQTKYYCADCAKDITEQYIEITNKLQNLFV